MPIRYGDSDTPSIVSTDNVRLGGQPLEDVRLGDKSLFALGPFRLPDGTIIDLPTEPIALPKLQINPPKSGVVAGLSKEKSDKLEALGLGALLAGLSVSVSVPCGGDNFLPTRADIVNAFNELTQIPYKIESQLQSMKTDLELKAAAIQNDIENFDPEEELTALAMEELEELFGIIEDIEQIIEAVADILSPWWKKGDIRNVQKEADDAWNELIQEYHIFVPVKMMEMISKLIPVEFTVNILGIDIDVLKILEEEEQERIIKQIEDEVDKYYALVPKELRFWDGEWGVVCDQWKARLTWQHIKAEIIKWTTNTLFALFEKLIDVFEEIWDALGLPDLPIPLSFDVEAWIDAAMQAIKEQALAKKDELLGEVANLEKQIEDAKTDIENFDAEAELQKQIDAIDIEGTVYALVIEELEKLQLFGISLLDVIGGDIEETVKMAEKEIDNLIKGARDWAQNWQKNLLLEWVGLVKKFLDAIGLGKILDLIFLTFCDVLALIGIPLEFKIEPPALSV